MPQRDKRIEVDGKSRHLHRYLMEQHLGRALARNERVIHKNGDRFDNRLENLEVKTSRPDPARMVHPVDPDGEVWAPRKLMECARALATRLARLHRLSDSDRDEIAADIVFTAVERRQAGWAWSTKALHFYARKAHGHLKRRSREIPVGGSPRGADPTPTHEHAVLDLVALQQAWPTLTARQKAVVHLRLQGLTAGEIGEETGSNEDGICVVFTAIRKKANGEIGPKAPKKPRPERRKATGICAGCEQPIPPPAPSKHAGPPRVVCDLRCQALAHRKRRVKEAQASALAIASLQPGCM